MDILFQKSRYVSSGKRKAIGSNAFYLNVHALLRLDDSSIV